MKWHREEDTHLVKAWQACASRKACAEYFVALSPNESYFIVASVGDLGIGEEDLSDMAKWIARYIEDCGWAELPAETVAAYLRDQAQIVNNEQFEEFEVLLVQNRDIVSDEILRRKTCDKGHPLILT